jgi:hypothetical protein
MGKKKLALLIILGIAGSYLLFRSGIPFILSRRLVRNTERITQLTKASEVEDELRLALSTAHRMTIYIRRPKDWDFPVVETKQLRDRALFAELA